MVKQIVDLVSEQDIVGDTTHGRNKPITFWFNDDDTFCRVLEAYRRGTGNYIYMDSRKLALTVMEEGDVPNVV